MQNVRRYADFIASLEGLAWLGLAWSISISMHRQSTEPTLAVMFVVATLVLFSWAHRPLRHLLRRYHIRKRRTDMWIHTLALPLLLAMFFSYHAGGTPRFGVASSQNIAVQPASISGLADVCHDTFHQVRHS